MDWQKIKTIIKILLIVLWMFLIFNFSNQNASNSLKSSDKVIYKIVEVIKGRELSNAEKVRIKKKYTFFIRKLAHFFLYFVLGGICFSLVSTFIKPYYKSILLSILLSFLYACSDEVHQIFVPGRTARFLDVLIDTSGAILAICMILLLRYIVNSIKVYYSKKV